MGLPFDVTVDPRGIICVAGECDMDDAPRLAEAVELLPDELRDEVIVDLGAVTYMGSAGLAALITLRNRHPGLRLRDVPDVVARLLAVATVDEVFAYDEGDIAPA